jgi:hypothetical protein
VKIALIIGGVIVTVIAIVLIIGALLPRHHSASRSLVFKQNRRAVYDVVRDVASAPQWREGVRSVAILGPAKFSEHSKSGVVAYDIVEDEPARRFVTRIADQDLGYSGSWTYLFEDAPVGSRLTITENGEVSNIFFRFMSRFVFGYTGTMETYLKSLQRRLG